MDQLEKFAGYPLLVKAIVSAVVLMVAALALFVLWRDPNSRNASKTPQQEISLSGSGTDTHRLPGLSMHMLIRVNNLPAARRKYLFDFGKTNGERLSIYISQDNIFTLSFVDAAGEPHALQVAFGGAGFPIGDFVYLGCEVGVSGQNTLVRMKIGGRPSLDLSLPFKVDIGTLDVPNGVVGADLKGNNGASFDLVAIAGYSVTVSGDQIKQLEEYFNGRPRKVFIQFDGTRWMRFGDKRISGNDLTQPDSSKAPVYRKTRE